MSRYKFWIFLFVIKLMLAELKGESDDRFLSGIELLYPKDEHMCGGVLISIQHVLTAASCVTGFEEGWSLSELRLSSGDGSQVKEALTFVIHSNYKHETLEDNLAIIKTKKPFDLTSDVSPITLVETNTTKDCFVVKWSISEKFITNVSSQSALQVYERPMNKCSMNVPKTLCMDGGRNVTLCQEDYGCPLVCETLLAGIFIGPGHACDGLPGVYVDVSAYIDWLGANSENFAVHFAQPKKMKATDGVASLIPLKLQLLTLILSAFILKDIYSMHILEFTFKLNFP